jgi:Tfp pilus assembly protein PilF
VKANWLGYSIDPHYAQAHRGLAYIFFASQQFDEAERYARLALKFDRPDWAAHTIMGRLLLRKGQIRPPGKSWSEGQNSDHLRGRLSPVSPALTTT